MNLTHKEFCFSFSGSPIYIYVKSCSMWTSCITSWCIVFAKMCIELDWKLWLLQMQFIYESFIQMLYSK